MPPITHVITDVEGTTSSIAFVAEVLFPYAAAHLAPWVAERRGDPVVRRHLDGARSTLGLDPAADDAAVVTGLLGWIREDRKDGDLKALQGLVWEHGFRSGAFAAHVYPEVPAALRRWQHAGLTLAVYSSGSIHAQRLFFAHTIAGDLSPLFSAHFDTTSGAKRDPASYRRIAAALGLTDPTTALFLSDTPAELEAATAAGLRTHHVTRDASPPNDFDTIGREWGLP